MQKIFAAIMTIMVVATVIAVFALGVLSLTGGPGATAVDSQGATGRGTQSGAEINRCAFCWGAAQD